MKIAFLGLGKMGAAVAKSLLKAGHEVTVWNRTSAKAQALAGKGAKVAAHPADAVKAAEAVFTMLMDDDAVESVTFGGDEAGILDEMKRGAIHVSLSTISVKLSRRLDIEHRSRGLHFVGAPVFGRPNIAEEGKLWMVAAGEDSAISKMRPVFEQMGRGLTVISDQPWRAHALKLGGNFLITAMIESVSEALVYAEAQGIPPQLFLETVNDALFQSPFYANYGNVMLNPPAEPNATIALGAKDTRLFREAAQGAGVTTPFADRFAADLQQAADSGLKDSDWAAGLYKLAQSRNQ